MVALFIGGWGSVRLAGLLNGKNRGPLASIGHFFTGHAHGDTVTRGLGIFVALGRRKMKPLVGLDARFSGIHLEMIHAAAMVSHAETELGTGVATLRGFANPDQRGGVVLGRALSVG